MAEPTPILLAFPGNETAAVALAGHMELDWLPVALHSFPDGETRVTLPGELGGREVLLLDSLDRPDAKLAPLLFAADAARELGASKVGLVAPYLAYMRQDMRFQPGEAISSRTFAAVLSRHFDWLATVDPHLHRYKYLSDIYSIPAMAVSAVPAIASWLQREVELPLLIGPDSESAQWTAAVALALGAPYLVLDKQRHGDRDVSVSLPDCRAWPGHTPVLLDDIVSTARTMAAAIGKLRDSGMALPVCIAVHAVFTDDAWPLLRHAGAGRLVSCNTIAHPTNAIDVMPLIAQAIAQRNDSRGNVHGGISAELGNCSAPGDS